MNVIDVETVGPVLLKQVLTPGGYYCIGKDSREPDVIALFFSGQHIDNATTHFR